MRQGNQIDLRSRSGSRTVVVVPGESAQFIVNAQQSRIGAGGGSAGLYNYVRGIILKAVIRVQRTVAEGALTPIWADRFPMAIKSINLNTPMDGTIFDPTIMSGMVAKHLFDYVGNGYREEALNEQPIGITTALVTRTVYFYLPFAQKWSPWPDHFAKWLGWLNDAQFEIFVQDPNADAFEATTGNASDVIVDVTMSAVLDMVPWPEIIIPPDIQLRRYEVSANASSNGPTLINVGSAGALQGVEDGSRLVGMFFSHEAEGFTGSGTSDQIQSTTLTWRDQTQTLFTDALFLRWLQTSHMRPPMGFDTAGASASQGVDTTTPYPNQLEVPGNLNFASARYTPYVWPEIGSLITYFQKVKGNYPMDMVFSTPQSNVFRVFTLELKQRSLAKCSEMLAAMGVNPSKVALVPKLGRKNNKTMDPDKMWGLPRSVVASGK